MLSKPWGRRGELSAIALSSHPERFERLETVFLFGAAGGEAVPMQVESVWEHRGQLVFKFRGVDSISDAERWRRAEVRVPAVERPVLPEGEYYHSDLVGCEVLEFGTGRPLGQVKSWLDGGGPGLLEVAGPGGEILIPFAKSICVELDVKGRRIVVDLPEGLKDLNES